MIDKKAPLPPLREVIKHYQLSTKQSLGQNFLLDSQLTDKIAKTSPLSEKPITIIEIGPGPGGLTRSILNLPSTKKLYAIEMDRRCYAPLEELKKFFPDQFELIKDDALKQKLHEIGSSPRAVIANLPYNVATPILIKLLRYIHQFEFLSLMFQKEVAERICAHPGSKNYGRLSVMSQWLTKPSIRMDISPRAFTPPPKVTSAIVDFIPRPKNEIQTSFEKMEKITKLAFAQRRKMLRSSLKNLWGEQTEAILKSCNIDPQLRAEALEPADFVTLSLKS